MNAFPRYVVGCLDFLSFVGHGARSKRSLISALQEQNHNLRRMVHEAKAELGKAEGEACHWKREAEGGRDDLRFWTEAYEVAIAAGNEHFDRATDLENRLRVARLTNGRNLRRYESMAADLLAMNGYVANLEEKLTELDPDWKAEPSDAPDAPEVTETDAPKAQPFADILYPLLIGGALLAAFAGKARDHRGSPETTEDLGVRSPCHMPEGYACGEHDANGSPIPHPGEYEPGHRAEVEIARSYHAVVSEAFAGVQK